MSSRVSGGLAVEPPSLLRRPQKGRAHARRPRSLVVPGRPPSTAALAGVLREPAAPQLAGEDAERGPAAGHQGLCGAGQPRGRHAGWVPGGSPACAPEDNPAARPRRVPAESAFPQQAHPSPQTASLPRRWPHGTRTRRGEVCWGAWTARRLRRPLLRVPPGPVSVAAAGAGARRRRSRCRPPWSSSWRARTWRTPAPSGTSSLR